MLHRIGGVTWPKLFRLRGPALFRGTRRLLGSGGEGLGGASEMASGRLSKAQEISENGVTLEKINSGLFRASPDYLWKPIGARGVFGGQMVGQALVAAQGTVGPNFKVHSLHSSFLAPGSGTDHILYWVQNLRDGRSYCQRHVVASQKGKNIFSMMASFAVPEEGAYNHQAEMPKVPPPEDLKTRSELQADRMNTEEGRKLPEVVREVYLNPTPLPFDVRPTNPDKVSSPDPQEPKQSIWVRSRKLHAPDGDPLHACVLACASDFSLLGTAILPYGSIWTPGRMMASLDHSMWFHDDFRADEWLLYDMESERASQGRGHNTGKLYTQDGRLVVTVAQEGVVRLKAPQSKL